MHFFQCTYILPLCHNIYIVVCCGFSASTIKTAKKKRRKTISTLPAKSKWPSDIELVFNFAGGMAKKGPTNIHLTGEF